MRTTKPISTISYNTEEFLKNRLEELRKAHKIAFWSYIEHLPENDETKKHKHLYIEPNGKIDTMDLQDMLIEIDLKNPTKPLKCVDWRNSKWEDWYFYGLHYEPYLRTKFEVKEYTYLDKDFISCDYEEFEIKSNRALHSDIIKNIRFNEMLNKGITVEQMAYRGMLLPIQSVQFKNFADMFYKGMRMEYRIEKEINKENPLD